MNYRELMVNYLNQSLLRPYGLFNKQDAIVLKFVVDLKANEIINEQVFMNAFHLAKNPQEIYKYLDKAYCIVINHYNIKVQLDNNNYIIKYM